MLIKNTLRCCIPNCLSSRSTNVTLFKFPRCESRGRLWLQAVGFKFEDAFNYQKDTTSYRLCLHHFEEKYIYSGRQTKNLLQHAVPKLNLPKSSAVVAPAVDVVVAPIPGVDAVTPAPAEDVVAPPSAVDVVVAPASAREIVVTPAVNDVASTLINEIVEPCVKKRCWKDQIIPIYNVTTVENNADSGSFPISNDKSNPGCSETFSNSKDKIELRKSIKKRGTHKSTSRVSWRRTEIEKFSQRELLMFEELKQLRKENLQLKRSNKRYTKHHNMTQHILFQCIESSHDY